MQPHIFHLDMDAFFAAIEVMDHPEWAGKPLVVGSPPDKRGVVSTASYEARRFGIHSAMPSRTAYQRCPHAIFAPVRMPRYLDVSGKVMAILHQFTPVVEQVSVDEAFLDVQGVLRVWPSAEALARAIKERIVRDTGLTGSIGLATNKFLAKLASDLDKPDGLTVLPVDPAAIRAFLAPLPVGKIWGVGKVMEKTLHQAGIRTIGDLQHMSAAALAPMIGHAMAEHVTALARGVDERAVITESSAKSISAECTFDEDIADRGIVRQQLMEIMEQVGRRLRDAGLTATTVHIKIRFEDFQTMTRQETLDHPVCSDRKLIEVGYRLFERQRLDQPVRLIGFGVSGLDESGQTPAQLTLFEDPGMREEARQARLDRAVDTIRDRMGERSIVRGSRLPG